MPILSYVPPAKREAARKAVKAAKAAAPKPDCQPDRLREAAENGYLDYVEPRTSVRIVQTLFHAGGTIAGGGDTYIMGRHARHVPTLHRDPMYKPVGIDPTLIATGPHGSGRSDVGQPVGIWNDSGPDVAIARPDGWQPRPAWDAIESKPMPAAPAWESVWTVDGWKPRRLF